MHLEGVIKGGKKDAWHPQNAQAARMSFFTIQLFAVGGRNNTKISNNAGRHKSTLGIGKFLIVINHLVIVAEQRS